MASIDIFKNSAFNVFNLTKYVSEMPYIPGTIGELGLFGESQGVTTTVIGIENEAGTLALVPSSERGGAGTKNKRDTRFLRYFQIPHKKLTDDIVADEVQNVRAYGSDSELLTVTEAVKRKQARLIRNIDTTVEYMRLGAVKGIIYDADGSTPIYNLFTEFNIAQDSVDFVLGTTTTEILDKCMQVRSLIQAALGYLGTDSIKVGVVCGETWFRRFITHPKVAEAYKYYQTVQQSANPMQRDLRYKGFTFGDITFWVYRGSVGGVNFVAPSEAHAFPMDVPDVFAERYAPADYFETVNTEGLPRYSRIAPDYKFNRGAELEVQSNPLAFCTRPKTLVKLTTGN